MQFYRNEERRNVDDGYTSISFPFLQIVSPDFFIKADLNKTMLAGYLNSCSAVQKFVSKNNYNPVKMLLEKIKRHWSMNEFRTVTFH
ncbi:MAG: hypothetical protein H7258_14875 [Ferruginibacter sp.]|nr:hypothetical protein [Ferruginibacter sp.]